MTESVDSSPLQLFEVAGSSFVQARLLHTITEQQLNHWAAEWRPVVMAAVERMRQAGTPLPQDRHWNWQAKTQHLRTMLAHQFFAIECQGMTQGLMIVDTSTRRCRLESQKGQHLVYIDYVEVAPWNRPGFVEHPRYRGIGSQLVAAAITLSQEEEFKGRVGLHSLPQADGFYRDVCEMTDMGPDDDYSGMHYFEMTPEQALKFINGGDES